MCNGLESVTKLTCALAVTGGETCYFESLESRCSADVTPVMACDVNNLFFKFRLLGSINMDVHFFLIMIIQNQIEIVILLINNV